MSSQPGYGHSSCVLHSTTVAAPEVVSLPSLYLGYRLALKHSSMSMQQTTSLASVVGGESRMFSPMVFLAPKLD